MRLFELANNQPKHRTAVFTFGRCNPPTIGHEKLVQTVQNVAQANDADSFIFLSQTQKKPKDPLSWQDKLKIFKMMFPSANVWEDPAIKTPFQALGELAEDYKNIILVVGDDRAEQFALGMGKYAKEWDVENFSVVSAGGRDPNAEGVEGMSASKARSYVAAGDFPNFASSLPNTISTKQKKAIFQLLTKSM
jgi:hypothetical protein